MESEGWLPHSQVPAKYLYPKPAQSRESNGYLYRVMQEEGSVFW
jgi:hypothetical protein